MRYELHEYQKGRVEKPGRFRFYIGGRGEFYYEEGRRRLRITADAPGITKDRPWVLFMTRQDMECWETSDAEDLTISNEKRDEIIRNIEESLLFLNLKYRIVTE